MRICIFRGEPTNPTKDQQWDNLEWDDQAVRDDPKVRALLASMVAQSLNDWAAMENAKAAHDFNVTKREDIRKRGLHDAD